jgi:hypothetical protein
MPIIDPNQRFTATIRSDDGVEVLHGQFSELMTMIPGSTARLSAEQAIAAARMAEARATLARVRSDDIDRREAELKARAKAMLADMACRLSDGVEAISRRLDALEERRASAQADRALAVLRARDDGPLQAVLEAPEPEEQEAEAQIALEHRGDGLPKMLDDGFICGRDRKAARKLARRIERQQRLNLQRETRVSLNERCGCGYCCRCPTWAYLPYRPSCIVPCTT